MTKYQDGVPCEHVGCLSHRSHPCEVCGRIGGITPRIKYHALSDARPHSGDVVLVLYRSRVTVGYYLREENHEEGQLIATYDQWYILSSVDDEFEPADEPPTHWQSLPDLR